MMQELVRSRFQYRGKSRGVTGLLNALGIPYLKSPDKDFWEANAQQLPELYELLKEEARERLAQLHPDHGGDEEQFKVFIGHFRSAQKNFAWHLQSAAPATPSTVKFTPIEQVRRDRRAAQARIRRRKNRTAFRAYCRERYYKRKAAGKIDKVKGLEAVKRYQKRHRRKILNSVNKYRHANPEKVRQWKKNYKATLARRGQSEPLPGALFAEIDAKRNTPGTPEYERRREWRNKNRLKHRDKLNAKRRLKYKEPRQRDSKGHFLSVVTA